MGLIFVIIHNVGIKINTDVNAKSVIKDLFGILIIASMNVIKHDVGEYTDYENCNCRKQLVDKLIDECAETVEVKLAKINLAENKNKHKCNSCTLYIVLMMVVFK